MINSFLVSLHNTQTQPVNPSSTTGDLTWPANVKPKTYTGPAVLAEQILFAGFTPADFEHFLIAIQLLWVVQESVCADRITLDDTRITYNQDQLVGQFEGYTTFDYQNTSRVLQQFTDIPALQFLEGDLREIYRSSLCKLDRLAAVISYFGARDRDGD